VSSTEGWEDLFEPSALANLPEWETPTYEIVHCKAIREAYDRAVRKLGALKPTSRRFCRDCERINFELARGMRAIENDPIQASQLVLNLEPMAYRNLGYISRRIAEMDLIEKHMCVEIPEGTHPLEIAVERARANFIHFPMVAKDYFSEDRQMVWNVCRQMSLLFPDQPFGISQSKLAELLDTSQGCISAHIRDGVVAGCLKPVGSYRRGRRPKHYQWLWR
jgi:hypothetical protein